MFRKQFTTDLLDPRCFMFASTLGKIFYILCGQSSYSYGVLILWEAGLKGALCTKVTNAFGDYIWVVPFVMTSLLAQFKSSFIW